MQLPSMASLHALTVPRLDLIFPEHFQEGLPVDGTPILGWSNQELLFRWTCKVKSLTPEKLFFKWRSEDNPYGVMRSDLNASIRQWEIISFEHLQNELDKLSVQISICLSSLHKMEVSSREFDARSKACCARADEAIADFREQKALLRACCARADEAIAASRESRARSKECCARADEAIADFRESRARSKEHCSRAGEMTVSSSEVHSRLDIIEQGIVQDQLVNRTPIVTDHLSWFGRIMNHLSQFIDWVKERVLTICGRQGGR